MFSVSFQQPFYLPRANLQDFSRFFLAHLFLCQPLHDFQPAQFLCAHPKHCLHFLVLRRGHFNFGEKEHFNFGLTATILMVDNRMEKE
jgi:hypothetical protein